MADSCYESKQALCCFYNYETNKKICCEGIVGDGRNVIAFGKPSEKKEHCRRYCYCDNYKQCPLYQAIMHKYK